MLFPQCLHIVQHFLALNLVFKLYPQLPADAPIIIYFFTILMAICCDTLLILTLIDGSHSLSIIKTTFDDALFLLWPFSYDWIFKKSQYLPQIWRLCSAVDDASEQVDLPVFSSSSTQIHLCWWGAAATQLWCHLSGQPPHLHLTTIALDPPSLWVQWARNDFWCLQEYEIK